MSNILKCKPIVFHSFLVVIAAALLLCLANDAAAGWKLVDSKSFSWLRSVYFVDEDNGWIVGSKGTFLATSDRGKTWNQKTKFTDDNIRDVYFSSRLEGWLLCERDIYKVGTSSPSYLLRTSDGGDTWERVEFKDNHDRLVRFFFSKNNGGFAVGEGGVVWKLTEKDHWAATTLPTRFLVLAGQVFDDSNGILVGGCGTVLQTNDGGSGWIRIAIAGNPEARFNSVYFADRNAGWIVGAGGTVYATRNGGKSWMPQSSGISEDLTDVFFVNADRGFAVGDGGRIVETGSGGRTWNVADTHTTARLERVFFTGGEGFAVGYGGTILRYLSP